MNSDTIILILFSILFSTMLFSVFYPFIYDVYNYKTNHNTINNKNNNIELDNIQNLIHELEIDYKLGLVDHSDYKKYRADLNIKLKKNND